MEVYVVTHGQKFSALDKSDPRMTPVGFAEVAALSPLLPPNPSTVICGTGNRHLDVASALGLTPTRFTSVVGNGDSLETKEGRKIIVLAGGLCVDYDQYTSLEDEAVAAKQLVRSLPHNSVICSGRPFMIMLGIKEAKSAAVYRTNADGIKEVTLDQAEEIF